MSFETTKVRENCSPLISIWVIIVLYLPTDYLVNVMTYVNIWIITYASVKFE